MRSRQSFTARSILENGTSSGIGARYYTGMSKLGRNAFLTRRQLPPNFGGGGAAAPELARIQFRLQSTVGMNLSPVAR